MVAQSCVHPAADEQLAAGALYGLWRECLMPKVVTDAQIFDAMIQAVVERGYAGATTRQVAEAAEVSEVTLFRRFHTKAQLVAEAVAYEVAQSEIHKIQPTGDVAADLLRVVETYSNTAAKRGAVFPAILAEIPRYPELRDALKTPFTIVTAVGNLIAHYQAENVLRQEHPLHAVSALIGPIIIMTMMRRADPDSPIPPPDFSAHVEAFLEGRRRS
jgi:AcrR family transcriptional regulator